MGAKHEKKMQTTAKKQKNPMSAKPMNPSKEQTTTPNSKNPIKKNFK